MGFQELRRDLPIEEFDYQLLLSYLSEYANPRNKISQLIKQEKIIRVKKGLYIFGPNYTNTAVCKSVLANLIYTPSYISCESALAHYGMIPERVENFTSVTLSRSQTFHTPIGAFTYHHLHPKKFHYGVTHHKLDRYHNIFIASAEKALIDQIHFSTAIAHNTPIKHLLFDDLRIDQDACKNLSIKKLQEIGKHYTAPRIKHTLKFIKDLQKDA